VKRKTILSHPAVYLIVSFVLLSLTACVKPIESQEKIMLQTLEDLSEKNFQLMKSQRIFFAHQSVGKNIIDGLELLMQETGTAFFNIREIVQAAPEEPAFLHAYVGENRIPETKIAAFQEYCLQNDSLHFDVAALKFCFVDVDKSTDVVALFENYQKMVTNLQNQQPEIKIVHFTVPIMARSRGFKHTVKKMLGRRVHEDADNVKREEYNDLIRNTYRPDRIFDIAYFESIGKDGNRYRYTHRNQNFYTLQEEWTDDGGHLNTEGSVYIAEQLILFLSGLE